MSEFNKRAPFARITRRQSLLTIAGAAAAALPGHAAASSSTTIRVGTPVSAVQGVKAGVDAGFFREENIDIQFVVLGGGPNILAATVGGSIDIGYADLFAWAGALDHGFDLQFLQSANGRGQSDFIIAGPKSGVRKPQDLKGRTIGVDAFAQSKLRVLLYLEHYGLTANDVRFITIGQRDTTGAALASGQIDAAISADPAVAEWQKQFGVVALEGRPWRQLPAKATTAGFFATKPWLSKNADVARSFVRAARKGAHRFNELSAVEKANLYLKHDKIDLFEVEKTTPGVIERANDSGQLHDGPIDIAATLEWLEIARSHGVISKTLDLQTLLYPTATQKSV